MTAKKTTSVTKLKEYDMAAPQEMADMALVLKNHVVKQKLYSNIKGKNYAHVEGWQFAGGLMGLYPRVLQVENLSTDKEIKWKADVEIVRLKDDKVVGRGFALCSNQEQIKKTYDEYAIMSMAQTRAIGKAYRNMVGWVMKLAGYEGTPSEEMSKMGVNPETKKEPAKPPTKKATVKRKVQTVKHYECHECAVVIDKVVHDYSKRVHGKPLCRGHQPKKS